MVSSRFWGAVAIAAAVAAGGLLVARRSPSPGAPPEDQRPLTVAAASDLARVFPEIGASFEKGGGRKVTFVFGASGLLSKQITEGAPFDVYAAASVSFVDDVIARKACFEGTKAVFAVGHVALWTKKDAPAHPATLGELTDPRIAKIAIANPEHAPYGRAAKQALQKAGVWEKVSSRVVYGENVQQALQYAQSGNADVALVGLSLAAATEGAVTPIDASLHDPIEQAIVVCRGRGDGDVERGAAARSFTAFVRSAEGKAILERRGFGVPDGR